MFSYIICSYIPELKIEINEREEKYMSNEIYKLIYFFILNNKILNYEFEFVLINCNFYFADIRINQYKKNMLVINIEIQVLLKQSRYHVNIIKKNNYSKNSDTIIYYIYSG